MKKYKILWSKPATKDLENIIDFIANDNKSNALKILKKIEKRVYELEEIPQRGSIVDELDAFNLYKYKQLIEYPWRIIYRIGDDSVFIMAVLDGRRHITDVLKNRKL